MAEDEEKDAAAEEVETRGGVLQGEVIRQLGRLCNLKYDFDSGKISESELEYELNDIKFILSFIYIGGFRHLYSDILPVLKMHARVTERSIIAEMGDLAEDVSDKLFKMAKELEDEKEKAADKVRKLADQVALEYQRLSMLSECFVEEPEVADLAKRIEQAKHDAGEVEKTISTVAENSEKAIDEVKLKYERESMTVLGILSAVVLAITSGMTFAASGINQVAGLHPMHILLVVLGVGFVLFNLMGALFTFLRRSLVKGADQKWGKMEVASFFVVDAVLLVLLCATFVKVLCAYQAVG